jgi:hypothetical protein
MKPHTLSLEAEKNFKNKTFWAEHQEQNIVAYLLKARTVEPAKQPLLTNGSETTFVSRQRPRNGGRVLSARAVPRIYKKDNRGNLVSTVRKSAGKEPPFQGDLSADGEESPM